MPAIRLITLDLDDTLWPCDVTIAAAEKAHFSWIEAHAPRLAVDYDQAALREHRIATRKQRTDIAHDLTALRLASLRELLGRYGYPEGFADQASKDFLEHRNRVYPFPEVSPVLRGLSAVYHLISVTNGNADVESTGLRGHFHHNFRAEDVGAAKPDPALFEAALAVSGVSAREAVHLGDDPELDVEAARRFGMRALWINRFNRAWPEHLEPPEAEFDNLADFQTWLEQTT